MKIETYLINLDGSNERLQNATHQLNAQNVVFNRFSAVDGRGKPLSSFDSYNSEKAQEVMGRDLLNGEIGCYLSHLGCIEKFLRTDSDYLIVLEDDMKLSEDFKTSIQNILNYLDTHPNIDWYLINIGAKKKKLYKTLVKLSDLELNRAFYFPIRTIGLIWSRRGAEEFLKVGREMHAPIDNFLQTWLSHNAKGLSVWQPLVAPSGYESEIDNTRSVKTKKEWKYSYKRQFRMWKDRWCAIKNMSQY